MKKYLVMIFIYLLTIGYNKAFADCDTALINQILLPQEYQAEVSVNIDRTIDGFRYHYTVKNSTRSRNVIDGFILDSYDFLFPQIILNRAAMSPRTDTSLQLAIRVLTSIGALDEAHLLATALEHGSDSLSELFQKTIHSDDYRIEKQFAEKEIVDIPIGWNAHRRFQVKDENIISEIGFYPEELAPQVEADGYVLDKPPLNALKPGEIVKISIKDRLGPPTISQWVARGFTPVMFGRGEEGEEGSASESPTGEHQVGYQTKDDRIVWLDDTCSAKIAEIIQAGNALSDTVPSGVTLGPSTPIQDINVICDTFILGLVDQIRFSVEAGWIKHDLRKDRDDDDDHGKHKGDEKGKKKGHEKDDHEGEDNGDGDDDMGDADEKLPGVAKSIIKKLTKVRRECMRGKFGSVREKLRALIRQVNAQRGKHLTEEAYALIKFNAEFLLEKL